MFLNVQWWRSWWSMFMYLSILSIRWHDWQTPRIAVLREQHEFSWSVLKLTTIGYLVQWVVLKTFGQVFPTICSKYLHPKILIYQLLTSVSLILVVVHTQKLYLMLRHTGYWDNCRRLTQMQGTNQAELALTSYTTWIILKLIMLGTFDLQNSWSYLLAHIKYSIQKNCT